jgi:hypothetical protein
VSRIVEIDEVYEEVPLDGEPDADATFRRFIGRTHVVANVRPDRERVVYEDPDALERAIDWGRERADIVLVRLGRPPQTFSAGADDPPVPPRRRLRPPLGAETIGWQVRVAGVGQPGVHPEGLRDAPLPESTLPWLKAERRAVVTLHAEHPPGHGWCVVSVERVSR